MPYRSSKPPPCQHKPSASCTLCRREKNDLEQVGAWARESSTAMAGARGEPTDYASFVKDTALLTTTKASRPSSTTHSNKPSHNQYQPQQQRIKTHQPSLPVYTSGPKTPSSSVAATRSNSPIAHRPIPTPVSGSIATSTPRTVPVYPTSSARQPASPISSKLTAAVGTAGGKSQTLVLPRAPAVSAAAAAAAPIVALPGAHFVLARGGVCVGGEESESGSDSDSESEAESEESESESEGESEGEEGSDDCDEGDEDE